MKWQVLAEAGCDDGIGSYLEVIQTLTDYNEAMDYAEYLLNEGALNVEVRDSDGETIWKATDLKGEGGRIRQLLLNAMHGEKNRKPTDNAVDAASGFFTDICVEATDAQVRALALMLDGVRIGAMEAVLSEVRSPCVKPVGAPGSLMRKAWDLGCELRNALVQIQKQKSGLPCRVCSECLGRHHWVEVCEEDDPNVDESVAPWVGFGCKHCDARSEQCGSCEGPIWPNTTGDYCQECEKTN